MTGIEASGLPASELKKISGEYAKNFKEPEYFDFENHEIKYYEFSPKQDLISQKPIIFIGGFGKDAGAYQKEILKLVISGRKVIFVNPLYGIKIKNKSSLFEERGNMKDLPEVIKNKTNELLAVVQHLNIENADVVGHSQGGVLGTVLATALPNLVDKLILLNPAGLYGKDSTIGLIKRSLKEKEELKLAISNELDKDKKQKMQNHAQTHNKYYEGRKYKLFRLLKEIPGLVKMNLLLLLYDIHTHGKTQVSLVTSNKDATFPTKIVEDNLGGFAKRQGKEHLAGELFEYVDRYVMHSDENALHNYENGELLEQILNEGLEKGIGKQK